MATPRGQAGHAVLAIEGALSDAEGRWSGVGVTIGSYFGGAGDEIRQVLSNYRNNLLPNLVRLISEIPETDAARWREWSLSATRMLAEIKRVAQMDDSGTVFNIIAEIPAETVATVKRGAKKVAVVADQVVETATTVGKFGVVGLVAVAIIVVVVWVYLKFGAR